MDNQQFPRIPLYEQIQTCTSKILGFALYHYSLRRYQILIHFHGQLPRLPIIIEPKTVLLGLLTKTIPVYTHAFPSKEHTEALCKPISLLFEIMCSLIYFRHYTLRVEHKVANPTYNLPIVSLLSPKVSISTLWLFLLMYPVKFKLQHLVKML